MRKHFSSLIFFMLIFSSFSVSAMNNNKNNRNLKITWVTGRMGLGKASFVKNILILTNRYDGYFVGCDFYSTEGARLLQSYLDQKRNTKDYKYLFINRSHYFDREFLDSILGCREKLHLILVADDGWNLPECLKPFVINHIHITSRINLSQNLDMVPQNIKQFVRNRYGYIAGETLQQIEGKINISQNIKNDLLNKVFSYKHNLYKMDIIDQVLRNLEKIKPIYKKIKEDPLDFALKLECKSNSQQDLEIALLSLIMFAKSTGNKKLLRKIVNFLRLPRYLGKFKTSSGHALPTEVAANIMRFFDFDSAYDKQAKNYDFLIMPMILGQMLLGALLLK